MPMTIAIFRRSGEHFGFVKKDKLFKRDSTYLGWITKEGRVWREDGTFLGELVDTHYVMRRRSMATPASKAPKARPATPARPATRANKAARAGKAGWVDALEEFSN